MRTLLLSLLTFLFSNTYTQDTKVLFLGNSYTYVNDLPSILQNLANANEHTLIKDQNTPGGYRFMEHAGNSTSMNKIKQGSWDFVILQAQSQEPSWPIGQLESEVFPYAKILCDTIKHYNPCAEVLFFDTWGRKNGDSQNCGGWPPVCTFEGMNNRLLAGYYMMAEQNEASMSPVGIAWRVAREDGIMDNINLYSGDGSHPSVYGSYLSACVIYHSIFKEPVSSTFYNGLDEDEALYLQSVANTIFTKDFEFIFEDEYSNNTFVFNRDSYFAHGQSVFAHFSQNEFGNQVNFSNESVNETSIEWFFGDGTSSLEENPVHQFDTGHFEIKLIASNNCFSDSVKHFIDIAQGIDELNNTQIKIKTKNDFVVLDGLENIRKIQIFNTLGVLLKEYSNLNTNQLQFNCKGHKSLIIRFKDDYGQVFSKKIVL